MMTRLFLRSGLESKPDLIVLFLYLYPEFPIFSLVFQLFTFEVILFFHFVIVTLYYHLSHLTTTVFIHQFSYVSHHSHLSICFHKIIFLFINRFIVNSSIFIPDSSLNLLEFLSNKLQFYLFHPSLPSRVSIIPSQTALLLSQ